jgi:predicted transcriptional regulator
MKQSKLEQPQLKKKVIQELAIGTTKTDIAGEVGLSRSAVSRFSSREDIRELVRSETCNLLEVLPDAVENVKNLVKEMHQSPKQQFKDKELSYKASLRVLESVSILNSPSPSLQVINIVKDNQNEVPQNSDRAHHNTKRS